MPETAVSFTFQNSSSNKQVWVKVNIKYIGKIRLLHLSSLSRLVYFLEKEANSTKRETAENRKHL